MRLQPLSEAMIVILVNNPKPSRLLDGLPTQIGVKTSWYRQVDQHSKAGK